MTSEFSNLEYDQILSPGFKDQMDGMVSSATKEAATDLAKSTGKYLVEHKKPIIKGATLATMTLAAVTNPAHAQSTKPDNFLHLDVGWDTIEGGIHSVFWMVEEGLEKGHESFPKKLKAIVKKGAEGFAQGWATNHIGSHFLSNGDVAPIDVALAVGSTIAIAEETSIPQLINRFKQKTVDKVIKGGAQVVGNIAQGIDFRNSYWELNKLIPEAHYNGNKKGLIEAQKQALHKLQSVYGFSVFKRDKHGNITNKINYKTVNWLWNMMGDDHRLDHNEAVNIYNALHPKQTEESLEIEEEI